MALLAQRQFIAMQTASARRVAAFKLERWQPRDPVTVLENRTQFTALPTTGDSRQ
jgi:hypothetical protein